MHPNLYFTIMLFTWFIKNVYVKSSFCLLFLSFFSFPSFIPSFPCTLPFFLLFLYFYPSSPFCLSPFFLPYIPEFHKLIIAHLDTEALAISEGVWIDVSFPRAGESHFQKGNSLSFIHSASFARASHSNQHDARAHISWRQISRLCNIFSSYSCSASWDRASPGLPQNAHHIYMRLLDSRSVRRGSDEAAADCGIQTQQ